MPKKKKLTKNQTLKKGGTPPKNTKGQKGQGKGTRKGY